MVTFQVRGARPELEKNVVNASSVKVHVPSIVCHGGCGGTECSLCCRLLRNRADELKTGCVDLRGLCIAYKSCKHHHNDGV